MGKPKCDHHAGGGTDLFDRFSYVGEDKETGATSTCPMHLLKSRTFVAGSGMGFFYFSKLDSPMLSVRCTDDEQRRSTCPSNHTSTPTSWQPTTNQ